MNKPRTVKPDPDAAPVERWEYDHATSPYPMNMILDPMDLNTIKLRIHVDQLMPDRTQYKPYSITFGDQIWVEVTVTSDMVVDFNPHFVVLTPRGIAHVADQLATALDTMHDEFRNRSRNF